ncbi:hypothetical protein [Lichenibacterium dinghuense]|uniref:hypothetical protein n=1 Tax=Lichenibacterium dinghuense TaxID=2895977 RepID=UPI001F460273|nr:hypothetical protein [Lichenibacterium sp. 6Y81]
MVGIPVADMLGSPLSGWLLIFDGALGLHGWPWLSLIEGLPAVLLGVACLLILSDGPRDAAWLSAGERAWPADRIAAEQERWAARHDAKLRYAFSGRTLAFAAVNRISVRSIRLLER